MTDDVVIQVNNVSKKFKSQVVLKDMDLGKQFFLNVYAGYFM